MQKPTEPSHGASSSPGKEMLQKRLKELIPSSISPLYDAARYSLLAQGKMLRPSLVLAAAHAFGAEANLALDPACALEMVHTYSLIHDDLPCMDDDDLRRGKPTLHKVFPEGIALLAGDYLLTYAFEVIAHAPRLSLDQKLRLVQILSRAAGSQGMIGGQAADIDAAGEEIDEASLLQMHRGKTGALLAAALQFGAVVGGAPESLFVPLENLGVEIGLAFQFLDDLLDATSNSAVLGKNVKRDAALKKPTAVTFYGIEGVGRKLEEFEISIARRISKLPSGAPMISSLLEQNLWSRNLLTRPSTGAENILPEGRISSK